MTVEQLDKDYSKYEEELIWSILRNKIAKDNDIKGEESEVVERAREIIRMQYLQGMPIDATMEERFMEFVHKYLNDENGKNYIKLYEEVINEKVFLYIKSNVTIKDKKIKAEDFRKLLEKEAF